MVHVTTPTAPARRAVKLSDLDLARVLDDLDGQMRDTPRAKQVFTYRISALRIEFEGTHTDAYSVPTRWLSSDGISFLFNRFTHQNVICTVKLITMHGTWNSVRATVRACRYLEPHLYEIELSFSAPIDPAIYCTRAGSTRVLVVDDQALMARLVTHLLKDINATVDQCSDADSAIAKAMQDRHELVLMDIQMPGKDGITAMKELRAAGFPGRIAAFTANCSEGERDRLLDLGFDDYISKPFRREDIEKIIEACRAEPIVSSMQEDATMAPMITEFVSELRVWVRDLQRALTDKDPKRIEAMARELRAHGTAFGFEVISGKALEIESQIKAPNGLELVRDPIHRLTELARFVRAPRPAPAPTPPPPEPTVG